MEIYTTKEVVKALGIKTQRLRVWVDGGFIRPLNPFSGKGSTADWDISTALYAAIFLELLEIGLLRKVAKGILEDYISSKERRASDITYFDIGQNGTEIIINVGLLKRKLEKALKS